jgi:hypothetical protein
VPDRAAFSRNEGLITDCKKSVTLKMTDAPLKAASSDLGLSKSPATTSIPYNASGTALADDISRVITRIADGDGDRKGNVQRQNPLEYLQHQG